MIQRCLTIALSLTSLFSMPAIAERADHDKPLQLEAQRITVDDAKKIQILEGDVVLVKGTIVILTDKLVITEDQYGFQKGIAFGGKDGLARFRQKREGKDEYVDGEAERIEYNTNNEVAQLFHRAWVKSGEDQVRGDYIWYDSVSEKYLVTAAENRDPKAPPQRVRATIQPKNKNAPPPEPSTPRASQLQLRGAGALSEPPSHD